MVVQVVQRFDMSNISLSLIKQELGFTAFPRLPLPTLFPKYWLIVIAHIMSGEVIMFHYLIREEGDKNMLDVC